MKRYFAILILLLFASVTGQGQNLRCHYTSWSKMEASGKFSKVPDRRLDYFEGKSAWYSESSYIRDSLHFIAFDDTGKTADPEAYGELTRTRSTSFDATTIDYHTQTFLQHYQSSRLFLSGSGSLSLPQWSLSEEEKEILGFSCYKATARYLGRDWTIWYAVDFPVGIGPWLLWGAPGLILEARDADNLFVFSCTQIEEFEDGHRFDLLRQYYTVPRNKSRIGNYTNDTLQKVELTYTKLRTDVNFFDQAHSIKSVRVVDTDGKELDRSAFYKYIPLIPTEYWNNPR